MAQKVFFYLLYSPLGLPLYCVQGKRVTLKPPPKKMKVEFRELGKVVQVMDLKATFTKKAKIQFSDSRVRGLIPMRM